MGSSASSTEGGLHKQQNLLSLDLESVDNFDEIV